MRSAVVAIALAVGLAVAALALLPGRDDGPTPARDRAASPEVPARTVERRAVEQHRRPLARRRRAAPSPARAPRRRTAPVDARDRRATTAGPGPVADRMRREALGRHAERMRSDERLTVPDTPECQLPDAFDVPGCEPR